MISRLSLLFLALAVPALANDAGMRAYEKTLFQWVRGHCIHCHDGRTKEDGISGPGFAVENLSTSYSRIKKYVRFDDIPQSYLVRRGGNMHCLKMYGIDCGTRPEDLRKAISEWWEQGEKDAVRTGVQTLPVALPSTKDFSSISWDLEPITGEKVMRLVMEVQAFQEAKGETRGAYRFRKPRLVGVKGGIHVKGLRFIVNGREDSWANSYVAIDRKVSESAVLSPLVNILPQDKLEGDQLAIQFDLLEKGEKPQCHHSEIFRKEVLAVLEARDCFDCHGGGSNKAEGTPGAKSAMNLEGNEEQVCSTLLQRCDGQSPNRSAIVYYALRGAHHHPRVIPFAYELEPGFASWVTAELAPAATTIQREAPPLEEK